MDEQLLKLIHELSQSEPASSHRRKCFTRLIIMIQRHPNLYRSQHKDYPEALNLTWEWAFKNIDQFDVDKLNTHSDSIVKGFIVWINGYLYWRVRDLFFPDSKYQREISLDKSIAGEPTDSLTLGDLLPSRFLNDLEDLVEREQQENRHRLGETIWDYIERDPEHQLRACHLRNHPDCSAQVLAIRLLLRDPPQRIRDIAREFEVSDQTLYSHWKKKCLPLLQEIVHRLE
ncbi:MAG: hypothetical protein HC835_04985 [Oscillatoriales cyanobacterium RM2_1_1]|nr:hypothetical protein [Oscillatoriales cyanobacterium SM2_3_0]NJO45022.1 hypothetical protein [Oscillatoriales cyanobacterium RM2_1_1]